MNYPTVVTVRIPTYTNFTLRIREVELIEIHNENHICDSCGGTIGTLMPQVSVELSIQHVPIHRRMFILCRACGIEQGLINREGVIPPNE